VTDGGSIDPLTTSPDGPAPANPGPTPPPPSVETPPPAVIVPPVIDNETAVDNGTYAWVIKVDMMLKSTVEARNDNGVQPPPPGPEVVEHFQTMVAYCQGMVVQAGGLLTPSGNGDVPLENGGTLITAGATVVTADLFV